MAECIAPRIPKICLAYTRKLYDVADLDSGILYCHCNVVYGRYFYTCVIYGWDSTCQASNSWIYQMGVNHLRDKQYQPFYNVLVEDGSIRYAAQGV